MRRNDTQGDAAGSPLTIDALPRALRARVSVTPAGCWLWTGGTRGGYGFFKNGGRRFAVHRVVYELLVGPIPPGLTLDHLCRHRRCCNPAHLEPVTQRENTRRGASFSAMNARKTHCPAGHPYDATNTRYATNGRRLCRACRNERARQYRASKR